MGDSQCGPILHRRGSLGSVDSLCEQNPQLTLGHVFDDKVEGGEDNGPLPEVQINPREDLVTLTSTLLGEN